MRLDDVLDASVVLGFSRIGYRLRRLPPIDADLSGATVVVTGATGGIGSAAALRLAALGASVLIVGRDRGKVERVCERARAAGGKADPHVADLSLMAEVRRLAAELVATHPRIDVLVNNVGALFPERTVTAEGREATFATDLLGHYVLTEALLPALTAAAPARIINVSSGGMYTQDVDLDDLESARAPYRGAVAYARAKRGQVLLTEAWAERLAGDGIVVHAMHPGWVDTPGVRRSLPTFRRLTAPVLRTPAQGADTIVWLAASEEAARSTGGFWHDRARRPVTRAGGATPPPGRARALIEALAEIAGR